MDRLKYLCNYSHDLISSTGTIPHIPPRLPKLSKTEKPCMPRKLNRREILSKKKKRRKKEKKNLHRHRSHHFTFLNVTNYCIFSSAHNQPPLELESISPPSLPPSSLPLPSSLYTVHDPYTRAATNFRSKFISAAMVLIGLDTAAEFSRFKGDKGR